MTDIPTVAEVRERLVLSAKALLSHDIDASGVGTFEMADRLDPDTQVIVTVESLKEAFVNADFDTHECLDCGGIEAWAEEAAPAIMRALTTASEGGRGSNRGET